MHSVAGCGRFWNMRTGSDSTSHARIPKMTQATPSNYYNNSNSATDWEELAVREQPLVFRLRPRADVRPSRAALENVELDGSGQAGLPY